MLAPRNVDDSADYSTRRPNSAADTELCRYCEWADLYRRGIFTGVYWPSKI